MKRLIKYNQKNAFPKGREEKDAEKRKYITRVVENLSFSRWLTSKDD